MADVDYVLDHTDCPLSDVQIVDEVARRERRVFTKSGRSNVAYVYKRFLKGATVRILGAHRFLPRVAGFADEMSSVLAVDVSANVYLMLGSGTGLNPH